MKNTRFLPITLNRKLVSNVVIIFMLAYFVFHSIYGSRGIIAYFKLQAELKNSHIKLEELRYERLEIENRAKLLRLESLDLDMVDEKARNSLAVSAPEEQVFRAETFNQPSEKDQ